MRELFRISSTSLGAVLIISTHLACSARNNKPVSVDCAKGTTGDCVRTASGTGSGYSPAGVGGRGTGGYDAFTNSGTGGGESAAGVGDPNAASGGYTPGGYSPSGSAGSYTPGGGGYTPGAGGNAAGGYTPGAGAAGAGANNLFPGGTGNTGAGNAGANSGGGGGGGGNGAGNGRGNDAGNGAGAGTQAGTPTGTGSGIDPNNTEYDLTIQNENPRFTVANPTTSQPPEVILRLHYTRTGDFVVNAAFSHVQGVSDISYEYTREAMGVQAVLTNEYTVTLNEIKLPVQLRFRFNSQSCELKTYVGFAQQQQAPTCS